MNVHANVYPINAKLSNKLRIFVENNWLGILLSKLLIDLNQYLQPCPVDDTLRRERSRKLDNMKKRTTINDIAREAGVSRQTVSRAINGQDGISDVTREKVLRMVDELEFRPNRLAQGMANSQTHTVGFVIGNITNPAHAEVISGIHDYAQAQNYNVFVRNTNNDPQQELEAIKSLQAQRVDGIVIVSSQIESDILISCADAEMPIVVVHREIEAPHVSSITTDTQRATTMVTNYLFGSGHTAIGLLTREGDLAAIRHVRGYRCAFKQRNLCFDNSWIVQAETNLYGGYSAAKELLTQHPNMTAIFAYNDIMAIGAMKACFDLGYKVPEDIVLFGYDDIKLASYVNPTLSTVRFHSRYVGSSAIERLLAMVKQPETIFPTLVVDMELIIRESTAAN